jgi:hypothetical protein
MSTTATTTAPAKATEKTTIAMMITITIIIIITTMTTKTRQVTPVSCTPYIHTLQCGVKHQTLYLKISYTKCICNINGEAVWPQCTAVLHKGNDLTNP